MPVRPWCAAFLRITTVLGQPDMHARAREVGAAMSQENGVAQALRLIQQTFDAAALGTQAA
jgi:hypothetical protein